MYVMNYLDSDSFYSGYKLISVKNIINLFICNKVEQLL